VRSDKLKQIVGLVLLASLALANHSCSTVSSNEEFFGSTTPPSRNIFRYVSGDEPETLDPTISNGQPEARLYLGLYEGLVEYNPKARKQRLVRVHFPPAKHGSLVQWRSDRRQRFCLQFQTCSRERDGFEECLHDVLSEVRAGIQRKPCVRA
jgi:hypothetical protein